MPRGLDLLDADTLRAALEPDVAARIAKLEVFTELDSTNRRLLAAPPPVGKLDVCIAEFQTAGRGRRGRRWSAPLGSGICLSVGWQFAGMPAEPAALTLAVGVAVRRVLERVAGLTIALKWPNDLVFDERKLGGILLELEAEAHGGAHVVAGLGLNVALPSALLTVAQRLAARRRRSHDGARASRRRRAPCSRPRSSTSSPRCSPTIPTQGFAAYRTEWRSADFLRGRAVRLDEPAGRVFGTALGIDSDGALLVETEAGERRRVVAGDVSVRSGR